LNVVFIVACFNRIGYGKVPACIIIFRPRLK
jgi:hypothetical protein